VLFKPAGADEQPAGDPQTSLLEIISLLLYDSDKNFGKPAPLGMALYIYSDSRNRSLTAAYGLKLIFCNVSLGFLSIFLRHAMPVQIERSVHLMHVQVD